MKLLYVTPEQLVKSGALQEVLQALCQRGKLARVVIDEVRQKHMGKGVCGRGRRHFAAARVLPS